MGELADNPKQNELVYPRDRRLALWVHPRYLVAGGLAGVIPLIAAWAWYALWGLPEVPTFRPPAEDLASNEPFGFPAWLRLAHFVNLLLMVLLIRSGLSILMDHPRLYWNNHCTPGSEWIRFTPCEVPRDRLWTAKDDSRYISPWLALPGFRHTIGIARHWHFLCAFFWLLNGLIFVFLLFATSQWKRLVPTDPAILTQAWAIFVHYLTFHLPVEPDGFYRYNPLQQLSYFAIVFLVAPSSLATGLAMSPAIDNWAGWYPRLFGGRQAARSLHFLALCAYLGFLVPHVGMVVLTGLKQNMNHIVLGTDDQEVWVLLLFGLGLILVATVCYTTHWISWRRPRWVQLAFRSILGRGQRVVLNRLPSRVTYTRKDISPYFWPNGKLPQDPTWTALSNHRRDGYRLKIHGLVETPLELSIADLETIAIQEQITLHHCIQGWSGIAQWKGIPLRALLEKVKPLPHAATVVFHSFGEGHYGGAYYDTLSW